MQQYARFDPAVHFQDPYRYYRSVRDNSTTPVFGRHPILLDYADVQSAFRDPGCQAVGLRVAIEEIEKESGYRLPALREVLEGMLLFDGPPGHAERRRYLARVINSRSLGQFQPQMDAMAAEIFASLDLHQGTDLMEQVAKTFPARFLNSWFGFPCEDLPFLMDCSDDVFVPLIGEPCTTEQLLSINSKSAMALDLVAGVIGERRANPQDDGLSRMVELAGPEVSDRVLASRFYFLFLVSTESMQNFIGSALWLLITHPEQLKLLKQGDVSIEKGLNELMRFEAPVQSTYRVCSEEKTFGKTTIPKGEMFMLSIGAAHRDPAMYSTPDVFNLARPETTNLAFAEGSHTCLGTVLAKMQCSAILKAFLTLDPLEITNEVKWVGNPTMRRIERLNARTVS